ncbi:MAG: sigma-70 family RNA polymerase sigma factor [Eubacteriales bacterium]|nr:sigma-70 family RNA polymerase sigma factor [Eubacteriales bacterium]
MKINDQNFIKELKKHNEKALLFCIDRYAGLLNSIVSKHLYSMKDRQGECLNDIFLAIWENIEFYDETKNSFQNWIAGIARYKSIDYLRKYLTERQEVNWEDVVLSEEDQALETLLEQELSEELEMILGCLSPTDREIFLKLFYEEKTPDEVSQEMGMKKETLYNHISRGKRRIRRKFPSFRKEYGS